MTRLSRLINDEMDCPADLQFHMAVANLYWRHLDQRVEWHTDLNEIIGRNTDIIDVSFGAPGIYCYQPWRDDPEKAAVSMAHNKWKIYQPQSWSAGKKRQAVIDAGMRACVPVFEGDLKITTGEFQACFEHKTFRSSQLPTNIEDVKSIMNRYPATSSKSLEMLYREDLWTSASGTLDTRLNYTTRRTEKHRTGAGGLNNGVRCPCVPAVCQPHIPCVSDDDMFQQGHSLPE